MKNSIKIIFLALFLLGCTSKESSTKMDKSILYNQTYYLNFKRSNDTMRFQAEKYDLGNWNNTTWTITKDSIFQKDSRGLSFSLGKDRRKYSFKNDTLKIWTKTKKSTSLSDNEQENIEQFLVLKSNEKVLEIIDLNSKKMVDHSNAISSDIQLR